MKVTSKRKIYIYRLIKACNSGKTDNPSLNTEYYDMILLRYEKFVNYDASKHWAILSTKGLHRWLAN